MSSYGALALLDVVLRSAGSRGGLAKWKELQLQRELSFFESDLKFRKWV